jgi:hypothetical protein
MNDAASLLETALGALFIPILLFSRWIRLKFASDPNKPTLPDWSIYLIMLVLTEGLSFGQYNVQPIAPESVTQVWWVQGLLFFIALLVADLGADATSTKSVTNAPKIAIANAVSPIPGGKP